MPLLKSPLLLLGLAVCVPVAYGAAPAAKVQFNRDIRPIMSDTCFHCHGFDKKKREAGLRMDVREEALKKTENDVYPIVPGKPEESEIIKRLFTTDEDDLMPPVKTHKELSQAQKELLRRWVAEGAVYEPHWAYAPLTKPTPPAKGNAVDAFIRAKLAEKDIQPSPEAPKAKLLRRVTLDITGLPPTPEEVSAFLADNSPNAYEQAVDRLLKSPRYGERMAVWWLDIARFADTVGFHGDQNQRIFPYRDYVINAFNSNKRFDQFTIEQLAGDLLPHPTTEQLVATGYNRLNMMTREGGAQPKEYLSKYGAERVRSVAAAWFGSTFGCAECHDHKFDPILTSDFYSLQSFFADVKQWGVYASYGYTKNPELDGFNNDYPFPPEVEVESPYLMKKKQQAEADLQAHLAATRERLTADPKMQAQIAQWATVAGSYLDSHTDGWATLEIGDTEIAGRKKPAGKAKAKAKDNDAVIKDSTVKLAKALGKGESLSVTMKTEPGTVASVRLEVVTTGVDENALNAALGKKIDFSVFLKDARGKVRKLSPYTGDATAKEPSYKDGADVVGVGNEWKLPKKPAKSALQAVWLLDPPVQIATGESLRVSLGGDNTLPVRISTSPFAAVNPLALDVASLKTALAAKEKSPAQRETVNSTWLLSTAGDRTAFDRCKQLTAAIRECRNGKAWSLVTQATEPLTIRVLPRGNWQDESGPVVLPSTPSFLPGRLESTAEKRLNRLDLAKWIVSKANPITGRAVMNRLWQQFFGVGLSSGLSDLGSQGEMPSHPELMDWLASEFRDSGWDFKHMIKLLVTSGTYRQSSSLRPELREIDPMNRLLASQNPRRLDAEFVRDNALAIAGVLNTSDIGGPSVKPYQPPGYYEALQFPSRDYEASTTSDQWRRGVYMHWQRTFLHPMLANFDAPARDECAAQRISSNTPQQALTLLNDPSFVEAARLLAARVLASKAGSDDERIDAIMHLAVARPAKDAEKTSLKPFLAEQRKYYRANTADADKLLRIGLSPPPAGDHAELAAWTTLCRVILNSQETITRY